MFEQVGALPRPRTWTTVASFCFESAALTLLVMLPMLHPESLPLTLAHITTPITAPSVPSHVDIVSTTHTYERPLFNEHALPFPGRLPARPNPTQDEPGTGDPNGPIAIGPIVPGSINDSTFTNSIRPAIPTIAPAVKPATRVVLSHLDEGLLIKRVQPVYPSAAKISHIEGAVLLTAVISPRGEITQLQVVKGHPFLTASALDAVRQWRYKPYVLNGVPIEVQTQITVNFSLR